MYAGKHVLTRSPLTTDGAEADELVALAERLNLRLLAGSDLLFEPALQLLQDMCHLRFASGICAHLHASSLEPRRSGRLTVVGSERLAFVDENDGEQRLTLHERARRGSTPSSLRTQLYDDRGLGGWSDALHRECEYFLSLVRTTVEHACARQGAAVVNVLEALANSLESGTTESVRERLPARSAEVTTLAEHRPRQ